VPPLVRSSPAGDAPLTGSFRRALLGGAVGGRASSWAGPVQACGLGRRMKNEFSFFLRL
jgi:hypothetical protein